MSSIEENTPQYKSLAHRKVEVIKKNLVSVCGLSVKSLIDKACFSTIEDGCEQLVNFTANLEQILLHQIRPQKNWYGGAENLHFWTYIKQACKNIPQSCISNIDSIENIKSMTAKGRAFIRCALMEKRLSEYISTAVKQTKLTKKYYLDGAILLSEEATMICGVLLGLNSIDFSFCLKGQNVDLFGPMVIDYTPYLKYQQSIEGSYIDEDEMRILNNGENSSRSMYEDNSDVTWKEKFRTLENKYRGMCEQKGYLEELLRMRENQLDESNQQQEKLFKTLRAMEIENKRERDELEQVILELQAQLYNLKSDHQYLQQRVQALTTSQQVALGHVKEIQMTDMAGERIPADNQQRYLDIEQQSLTSSGETGQTIPRKVIQTPDSRSLLSTTSEFPQREDSQSLIPLTGSLNSVDIRTGEPQLKPEIQVVQTDHSHTHSMFKSQDFEKVSLKTFEELTNESKPTIEITEDQSDPEKLDVAMTTGEDNSIESMSPVMVTSSESEEPVHITLDDVSQNDDMEIDKNLPEEEKEVSSVDEVTKETQDDVTSKDQSKVDLNRSSDSTSSSDEPVHLDPTSLKRNSDSGSSDTASWEMPQDRDLQGTSGDEQTEDKDEEKSEKDENEAT